MFDVFQRFKKLEEKQSGMSIKVLRTDGGGAYVSSEFARFCEEEGMVHEITPPYTSQHNGTAEIKNRSLLNMVRCMLKCKNLPPFLWGEAVSTTSYVLNRCPTKRLDNLTPEEAWTGVKPDISHLRIFGSLCWKRVPDQIRQKLDDKGIPQVMVDYHSTGGYKLFDPQTNQVSVSRDVVIDEASEWDWQQSVSGSSQSKVILADEVESDTTEKGDQEGMRRSSRVRQQPTHLQDYDLSAASFCIDSRGRTA